MFLERDTLRRCLGQIKQNGSVEDQALREDRNAAMLEINREEKGHER